MQYNMVEPVDMGDIETSHPVHCGEVPWLFRGKGSSPFEVTSKVPE